MSRVFEEGLVSVITPVYNAEAVIENTLNSVFNQTYKKIEIILIDDCSTDNSGNVINSLVSKHPNIIYRRLSTNQGAGVARNMALELAKGQYVAFLDADDVWHSDKTEKQINLLNEKNGAFSYTAIRMIDVNGKVVKKKCRVRKSIKYSFLLRNTMIATSTVLIDRCKIGDFRMSVRRGGQDYATWLSLLRNGTVAFGLNEALEDYRIGNKKSLAGNKFKSIKQVWEIQTQDEGIFKPFAFLNVCCFIINAAIKYLIK